MTRTKVNIWNQVAMFVTLVGIWVLLWDDVSVLSIASGFGIAFVVTRIFYLPPVEFSNRINPWFTLTFLVRLFADIVTASFRVAWQVLTLPTPVTNAIVAVQLRSRSEGVLVWTTEVATIVPGSLVIEVDRERSILYLHVLGAHDDAALAHAREVVLATEARIVRAIGSRDDLERIRSASTVEGTPNTPAAPADPSTPEEERTRS